MFYTLPNWNIVFADFLVSVLVLGDVSAWPLQQLLLCLSPSGHCHGSQDSSYNLVFCHSQWQTGKQGQTFLTLSSVYVYWFFIFLSVAHDDSGAAGCGGVPLHCGCFQFLPQVLQQKRGWGWARHEMWRHDDRMYKRSHICIISQRMFKSFIFLSPSVICSTCMWAWELVEASVMR